MSEPEPEVPSPEEEQPPRETSRRTRLAVGITGGALIAAATAAVLIIGRPQPGCEHWEAELDLLSEGLAAYVRAKGIQRVTALDNLEGMKLRCGRVEEARALCAGVYKNLHLAEVEHDRAKQALADLERAVGGLDEPTKTVAELRFIDNETLASIAERTKLSTEEVRRQLDLAREAVGAERISELHDRFDEAVKASKAHVAAARDGNEVCDAAYKRLLEEEQRQ